jgi:CBS domain-containing protein
MLCRDVMRRPVFSCGEKDTARRCAQIMQERGVGFVPVLDEGDRLVGVVTDRDLVLRLLAAGRPAETPVGAFMTRELIVCGAWETLTGAEDKMANGRKARLPVVDEAKRCLGVISLTDIAQAESRGRAGKILHDVTRREAGHPPELLTR